MTWEIILGFIGLFLTLLKGYGDLSNQIGKLQTGLDNATRSYAAEKADRQRAEDQLSSQVRECKEDHTARLTQLEKKLEGIQKQGE